MHYTFANPFAAEGTFFRGNLHLHTNRTDGELSLGSVVTLYRDAGYDFIAVTDHNRYFEGGNRNGVLLLSGEEIDVRNNEVGMHIVAVGTNAPVELPHHHRFGRTPQEIIEMIHERGGIAILAHPYTNGLTINDMLSATGVLAVEAYNNRAELKRGSGVSFVHWDELLLAGKRIYGIASDDAHHYRPKPDIPADYAGALVMVKAGECTQEAILAALRNGLFYSTMGPEIRMIEHNRKEVRVETSPVRSITFRSFEWRSRRISAPKGELITAAAHAIEGDERFIRVQCEDENGNIAFANPIFLDSQQELGF